MDEADANIDIIVKKLETDAQSIGLSKDHVGVLKAVQQLQGIVSPDDPPITSFEDLNLVIDHDSAGKEVTVIDKLNFDIGLYKQGSSFKKLEALVNKDFNNELLPTHHLKNPLNRGAVETIFKTNDLNNAVRITINHPMNNDDEGKKTYRKLPLGIRDNIKNSVSLLKSADQSGGFLNNLKMFTSMPVPEVTENSVSQPEVVEETTKEAESASDSTRSLPTESPASPPVPNPVQSRNVAPVSGETSPEVSSEEVKTAPESTTANPQNPEYASALVEDFLKKFSDMVESEMKTDGQIPKGLELVSMMASGGLGDLMKKFLQGQQGASKPGLIDGKFDPQSEVALQSALPIILDQLGLSEQFKGREKIYTPDMGAAIVEKWPVYVQNATPEKQAMLKEVPMDVLVQSLDTLAPNLSKETLASDQAGPVGELLLNLRDSSFGGAIFQFIDSLFSMLTGESLNQYLPGYSQSAPPAQPSQTSPETSSAETASKSAEGEVYELNKGNIQSSFKDVVRAQGDVDSYEALEKAKEELIARIPKDLNEEQKAAMETALDKAAADAKYELQNGSTLEGSAAEMFEQAFFKALKDPNYQPSVSREGGATLRSVGGQQQTRGASGSGQPPPQSVDEVIEGIPEQIDAHQNGQSFKTKGVLKQIFSMETDPGGPLATPIPLQKHWNMVASLQQAPALENSEPFADPNNDQPSDGLLASSFDKTSEAFVKEGNKLTQDRNCALDAPKPSAPEQYPAAAPG